MQSSRLIRLPGICIAATISGFLVADSSYAENNTKVISKIIVDTSSVSQTAIQARLKYQFFVLENINRKNEDEKKRYGVWLTRPAAGGIYKQNSANFNSKSRRITIGFDRKITEDLVFGTAFSINDNKSALKNNTNSAKSKDDSKSFVGSLYGSFVANDNLLYIGNIEGGIINNRPDFYNLTSPGRLEHKRKSKVKGNIVRATLNVNYYTSFDHFMLVSGLGVSGEQINVTTAKIVPPVFWQSRIKKFSSAPSLKVFKEINVGNITLVPSLSISTKFVITNNALTITTKNSNIRSNKIRSGNIVYNFDTNVNVISNDLEMGLGYQRIFHKKYQANNWFLKLKANF